MKKQSLAVARGQDPEKIHNSGEYLKMLADLHELEAKIVNQFFKFVETGSLEDLEALKKAMKPHKSMQQKIDNERKSLCRQFDGPARSFCADVLYFMTESARGLCEKMEAEIARSPETCRRER